MNYAALFFLFKIVLAILSPLNLHKNFRINLLSGKKASWDFDRDYVESINQFREYCYFKSSFHFVPSLKR